MDRDRILMWALVIVGVSQIILAEWLRRWDPRLTDGLRQ